MKYTYDVLCFDTNTEPYISYDDLQLFDTKKEAFEAAYSSALEECDELNYGCDDGISFGIPEGTDDFINMDEVVVNYYYWDNTEKVTVRTIKRVIEKGE